MQSDHHISRISRRRFLHASSLAVATSSLLKAEEPSPKDTVQTVSSADGGRAATAQREPLAGAAYLPLPLGSIHPEGWMLKVLELQRDGITKHAPEQLPGLTRADSVWLNRGLGSGENWEKGPYYAKGLVTLAYTLGDSDLQSRAQEWVEAILESQQENGNYGPQDNPDWWPRMVVNYMLRDYAEATGDQRVEPFLTQYYRYLLHQLPSMPLKEWSKARAGDEIDTIFWLYQRNRQAHLLETARLLHEQAYPWREIFNQNRFLDFPDDFHPKHAVNVAQALKTPVVYSQLSQLAEDRQAYRQALVHLHRDHGTNFGINIGSEMVSGRSTVDGVELCAIVENMLSAQTAFRILGDPRIGDELELVAFNALPAAFSKDFRRHVYYTAANTHFARRGLAGYEIDYDDCRTPAPRSGCPCCCYNLHMGWPKLVQNAWLATPQGGLIVLAYIPCEVTTKVAEGVGARIQCHTSYPFQESVSLSLTVERPTKFPLELRIPIWCRRPQIAVNGNVVESLRGGEIVKLERLWTTGDSVTLSFPMETESVSGVGHTVSLRRGPLVYSLAMQEEWKTIDAAPLPGFEPSEIASSTPWNYALPVDCASRAVVARQEVAGNPYLTGQAPVSLQVPGKRVHTWKTRADGLLPLDPPPFPAVDGPWEELKLVPFGSQMLRITNFPVIAEKQPSRTAWQTEFGTDSLADWIVYRGGFVRNGRLHLVRGAKAIALSSTFSDFSLDADVRVGKTGDAGVVFRVTEPSLGVDHYRGYYVGLSEEQGSLIVGKADYAWFLISQIPLRLPQQQIHNLRVEMIGPRIMIWVNRSIEPVLVHEDSSFSSGSIGVRSCAHTASFGRLTVNAAGA